MDPAAPCRRGAESSFLADTRNRGSVHMTTTSKRLSITLLALVFVHAAGAHASEDARLCRQQVQRTKRVCLAEARAGDSTVSARAAAGRSCRQTARAHAQACQMRETA